VEGGQHTDLLGPLESSLCYTFRNSKLLLEALCHPTFRAPDTSSYQRLEFLGDGQLIPHVGSISNSNMIVSNSGKYAPCTMVAVSDPHHSQVIDLYVTEYLFLKYPLATPGQITWAKSRAVCNPTLGTLSGRKLFLHKFMLAYSPKLEASIQAYIELSDHVPYSQLVVEAWNWDPPKVFGFYLGTCFPKANFHEGYGRSIRSRLRSRPC
jgi:endoribonuclease Dicer